MGNMRYKNYLDEMAWRESYCDSKREDIEKVKTLRSLCTAAAAAFSIFAGGSAYTGINTYIDTPKTQESAQVIAKREDTRECSLMGVFTGLAGVGLMMFRIRPGIQRDIEAREKELRGLARWEQHL